jgi:hypothetical protein
MIRETGNRCNVSPVEPTDDGDKWDGLGVSMAIAVAGVCYSVVVKPGMSHHAVCDMGTHTIAVRPYTTMEAFASLLTQLRDAELKRAGVRLPDGYQFVYLPKWFGADEDCITQIDHGQRHINVSSLATQTDQVWGMKAACNHARQEVRHG